MITEALRKAQHKYTHSQKCKNKRRLNYMKKISTFETSEEYEKFIMHRREYYRIKAREFYARKKLFKNI